ncbi:hypothetical protein [Candidatus Odyssella thessalonicensis]|nr:hypothetical protein [Candidatus Odyssella thessalonicensis]
MNAWELWYSDIKEKGNKHHCLNVIYLLFAIQCLAYDWGEVGPHD